MAAVVGIAEHYGRAEFVVVGTRGSAPVVLSRQRVALIAPGLPGAPYHHEALEIPLADAEALVERVAQSVAEHTRAAIAEVRSRYSAGAVVLRESPFPRLPDSLAEVLNSWAMTCAADGMLYREALSDAAASLGLDVIRYPRKLDPIQQAADALGVERQRVASLVAELGRPLGAPWRTEHRNAAAAALCILARDGDIWI